MVSKGGLRSTVAVQGWAASLDWRGEVCPLSLSKVGGFLSKEGVAPHTRTHARTHTHTHMHSTRACAHISLKNVVTICLSEGRGA